ncbi:hypothetical protein P7H50_14310 [Enterococcus durans]|nr:hypothetical protein [Enterococcus durans]
MVNNFINDDGLPNNPDFSSEAIEFLFDHFDEMQKEAPETNDLIQTGDFIDDLDGWETWVEGVGMDNAEYLKNVKKDYLESLKQYQKEKMTDWKP